MIRATNVIYPWKFNTLKFKNRYASDTAFLMLTGTSLMMFLRVKEMINWLDFLLSKYLFNLILNYNEIHIPKSNLLLSRKADSKERCKKAAWYWKVKWTDELLRFNVVNLDVVVVVMTAEDLHGIQDPLKQDLKNVFSEIYFQLSKLANLLTVSSGYLTLPQRGLQQQISKRKSSTDENIFKLRFFQK